MLHSHAKRFGEDEADNVYGRREREIEAQITSKQLNDVALNGRNVLDYMKLVPGVSGVVDGHASGTGGMPSM
jgi:hypothetical protein